MPGAGSTSRGLEIRGLEFCGSIQHLDQPLELDPARSSAAMKNLAKRSLRARVVIGEQAPGEVRAARREDRKVRVRQLAFTTSCPRDVPSGSIALGLFSNAPLLKTSGDNKSPASDDSENVLYEPPHEERTRWKRASVSRVL